MSITSRNFRQRDLLPCLNVDPRRIGDGMVGHERAISIWKELLQYQSFAATVFECDHRVMGFGCGVFVNPDFAAHELANPHPGLNDRVIASMDFGSVGVV